MWNEKNFINFDVATVMQRLYQIKAEQDGRDVTVIAHAVPKDGSRDDSAEKMEAV